MSYSMIYTCHRFDDFVTLRCDVEAISKNVCLFCSIRLLVFRQVKPRNSKVWSDLSLRKSEGCFFQHFQSCLANKAAAGFCFTFAHGDFPS